MTPRLWPLALPCCVVLSLLVPSPSAEACGGTFCDNTAIPMPVDQTGEDILFIREGSEVEVHIRIAYVGEAERFSWVVPLQAIPDVTVGSEALFGALSQASAPSWFAQRSYECPDEDPNNWGDDGGEFTSDSADEGVLLDVGGGPEVVFEATVGAYEVVVLQGGTAAEVIDFLTDNDYAQDPEAEPILQEYLDEGFLFAAVKLSSGIGIENIHPLVFRMQSDEFCVPIRLTRIAANDDMGIRAYFLGSERWAPSNYDHVVLDPLRFDWKSSSGYPQYLELVSLALDEAEGGRGFVTDYAGPSTGVQTRGLWSPAWDETAFVGSDPIEAIALIADQGLNTHPLIQPLLLEYVPPPDGLDPQQFWNNIGDFADLIDLGAWDDVAFAAAIGERIIEPGLHATDLIEAWPYLTRLHTLLSPHEMTLDPTFHANPDLPDVARTRVTATQVLCGGDEVYQVEFDGVARAVCVPEATAWPSLDVPYALRIEQLPMAGPAQVLVDNEAVILDALVEQQDGLSCNSLGGGETGSGSESDAGTGSGATASGGDDEADATTSGPTYDLPYDTSCGCASERGEAPLAIALGLLVLGLARPRRRR
jgi:MYXO-CTERM domain-containing protein